MSTFLSSNDKVPESTPAFEASKMAPPRVLWIGVGNMGRGMCKNLSAKGKISGPLLLHNRTISRAEIFASTVAEGPVKVTSGIIEGVLESDIIFTCLAHDEAIRSTIIAAVDANSVKGKLFVDCSTIAPDTTEEMARIIHASGGEFVAAPVFGPPAAADAGQLIAVIAGPRLSVERTRPFFKGVMARDEMLMIDEPVGKATTLKLLGNTFIINMVEQLAEAHTTAERAGLGTDYLHQFIEKFFPGPATAYSTRMLSGDYHKLAEPLFGVDLARKDAHHAMSIATKAGVRLWNVETADRHLAAVQNHDGSKGDMAGIYGAMRMEAGLEYKN